MSSHCNCSCDQCKGVDHEKLEKLELELRTETRRRASAIAERDREREINKTNETELTKLRSLVDAAETALLGSAGLTKLLESHKTTIDVLEKNNAKQWAEIVELQKGGARRPRLGVAVIVTRPEDNHRTVLIGRRGPGCSHGVGTWALPGGHLEFKEDVVQCARREVLEETGIALDKKHVSELGEYGSVFYAAENLHYITIFVRAVAPPKAEPVVTEPTKCEGWVWQPRNDMPRPLFAALGYLVDKGNL